MVTITFAESIMSSTMRTLKSRWFADAADFGESGRAGASIGGNGKLGEKAPDASKRTVGSVTARSAIGRLSDCKDGEGEGCCNTRIQKIPENLQSEKKKLFHLNANQSLHNGRETYLQTSKNLHGGQVH